jgi:carboxymethylenebutenolidase
VFLQEIFGVTDQLKRLAAWYADEGFTVAIPALFDRVQKNCVVPFDQSPRGIELMSSIARADTLLDIEAVVKTLNKKHSKVVVMGFCLGGGGLAVHAAQTLSIAGAISFYGTRLESCLGKPLSTPVQFHLGSQDNHTSPEVISSVREAFPNAEYHLYEAGHAFANDARASYVETEAELAHQRSREFMLRL